MKCALAVLSAVAALALSPAVAGADTIAISGSNGLESLGSFSGSFSYDAGTQLLEVSLTNTSAAANGGYITAFAFNTPEGATVTNVAFGSTEGNFDALSSPIAANPFGSFDLGAASTSSWLGGGSPTGGIAVGDSETFSFTLTGTGLGGLTAADWLAALSTGASAGQGSQSFVVRFRGFEDGGSDKVPFNTPVPEPGTLVLLGAGAAGLLAKLRRRPV